MVYLFFGENTYARDQALADLLAERETEKIDGLELQIRDLPDLLLGQTLFANDRLVVVRGLSENTAVWAELENYLERIPDETTIIFVETKPDKRSRVYKLLQKNADTREFSLPKNTREAESFVLTEAKRRGMKLGTAEARTLVARAGMEPWELVHALEKLAVLDVINPKTIESVVEQSHEIQIFGLFEASLAGDTAQITRQIADLRLGENPHQAFGFLTSQVLQLAALVAAESRSAVAKDLGMHPFMLQKLEPYARDMNRIELRKVVTALADCDTQMKSSGAEPWDLIETALQKIATRN